MKKMFVGTSLLVASLFTFSLTGWAQDQPSSQPAVSKPVPTKAPSPAAPPAAAKPATAQAPAPAAKPAAPTVKYLNITIKSVKVWPVKPSGKCWDPCLGKKYAMPARGNKNYSGYFEDENFRAVCTGSKAPDPFVEIQIGQYEKFTTDKINNQCQPNINISHTYRVNPNDKFTVTVFDNDGGAGFQIKRDLMGSYTSGQIPAELLNGGTLTLRSFGQVEEIVLEAKVVEKKVAAGCDGVYKVRIAEFDVKDTKESGKTWDRGFGGFKKPDVIVSLKINDQTLETPKKQDTLAAKFTDVAKTIPIKKGNTATLIVHDKDALGQKEVIGETAVADLCNIVGKGTYTFPAFGRVNKVVLIFEKQQ